MKTTMKITGILLTLAMLVAIIGAFSLTASAATGSWGDYTENGSEITYTYADFSMFLEHGGTETAPYEIKNAVQLAGLAALVNAYQGSGSDTTLTGINNSKATATDFSGKYIKLMADIDLSAHYWVPIGLGQTNAFKGNFDGNGHTVENLNFSNYSDTITYAGLFGCVYEGKVENVGVKNLYAGYDNYSHVGGVVGFNYSSTVQNCYSAGTITGNKNIGGVVGAINNGTVQNCYNTGCVTNGNSVNNSGDKIGGVVGYAYGDSKITNCYNEGIISSSNSNSKVGGLAGMAQNSTLTSCYYLYLDNINACGEIASSATTNVFSLPATQMKAAAAATYEADWVEITVGSYNSAKISLVDALNAWASANSATVWHIHNGEYPTLGENGETSKWTDDNNHTVSCTTCGYVKTENHTPKSPATCVNRAVCNICNDEYGTENKENHDTSLEYNENGFCTGGCYQPAVLNGNVYKISNAGQLFWFAEYVNAGNTSANAVLTNDIVVNSDCFRSILNDNSLVFIDATDPQGKYALGTGIGGTTAGGYYVKTGENTYTIADVNNIEQFRACINKIRPWTPIGNNTNKYSGTFDGNGKTVSGLYFNDSSVDYVGMFGYVNGGAVNNLTVSNTFFNGDQDVGGVVGYLNNGTVENCTSYATVSGTIGVGGIAGYCQSDAINDNIYTISVCYNYGTVSGKTVVGGIIGHCDNSSVSICFNFGTVSGIKTSGGIVGYCNGSLVSGSCNNGNINGTDYVGGVVGKSNSSTVNSCYSANCTVSGTRNVCGIVGYDLNGTINRCYNESDVSGTYQVGGVIGYSQGGSVSDCYNTGNISGTENVGGVVAQSYDTIACNVSNCYNTGKVSGETNVGGIVGSGSAPVSNCYYLADSETDLSDGTTSKTSAQFASGEVAYLLNGDQTTIVWYQTCGTGLPAFSGDTVYKATKGCTGAYVNDQNAEPEHTFTADSNGFCTKCDGYQPAVLNGDVYEISNAGQLYWFAAEVNGGKTTINAKLTKDIVVNAGTMTAESTNARVWTPIGNNNKKYSGKFDGNCKTISGLYANNNNIAYVGLFGFVGSDGEVQNVGVINSYFSCKDAGYSGGVVGYNSGSVVNCYNTGTVNTGAYVGGVIGANYKGSVINCYNAGAVSGDTYVGGVIGGNVYRGIATNCYHNNTIYTGDAIGINNGTATNVEGKTTTQFASGEVAYLLNGDQNTIVWYQTCGEGLPAFSGNTVYKYLHCDGVTSFYTNDSGLNGTTKAHIFTETSNGFCTECNGYQPAVLTTDKYDLDGDKVNDDVYEISNAGQLYWFADKVNNENATFGSAKAVLTSNIVVNDGEMTAESTDARVWTPIGNETNKYSGNFFGNGKTVSGLYFNDSSTNYVGLFGYVSGGTVENVGVIDSYFYGGNFVGGVVGWNEGDISNCYNTGSVSSSGNYVGGVVGCNKGTVTNCYNTGSFSSSGYYVGGVAGYNNTTGTVTNCYNTGSVSGSGHYVGGVVGANLRTVEDCYNTGDVIGSYYVGGVVGDNSSTVTNCYNTGSVSVSNYYVGGVVGYNSYGTVSNCYYLTGKASGGINGADAQGQAEANTSAQFASGEVAFLLGDAFGQTIGTDALPVFNNGQNTVYRNQLSGCSADTFKFEYSNEQKAPVTTHDTTKYTYEKASIANSITATCDDCQTALTVTLVAPENAVYNGQRHNATLVGEMPGVEITVNYDTISQPINAGTYTASVTLGGVTVSVEYKIAQKVLVPTIAGRVTKVFDGTNAVPAGLYIVLDGIVGADNVTASAIYTFDRTDAGTKKVNAESITIIGTATGNYTLSSSTASADVGEITKAPSRLLTAPAAISGLVYNQQAQMLVTPGTAEFGTFVYSLDSVNWSTRVPTAVNAGNYTVFYKVAGDQNHLDSAPAVILVTVAQREIGIIWGQTAFDYNGERQAPTATATGVLPGDVCTVGTNGWGIYEGTYTITARTLSNPNYKLPAAGTSCQFTITTDYDKEADKVMDAVGDAANEVYEDYIAPAISNAFNEMLENLFKMFQNLFN